MFQGSKNHDRIISCPLEKLGAGLNGTTAEDRTIYYETVPSNALELALWLEADRMGFLLPAMTQAKLDNQRRRGQERAAAIGRQRPVRPGRGGRC